MKTLINRFLPPLVVMGIIFWWSTQSDLPGAQVPLIWWDFIMKKSAHLIEYALLFFTLQRAFNWGKTSENRDYRISFLIILLYAITDEVHQSFTPGRHPKITDVGYDFLGGFLVYLRLKNFI